MDYITKPSITIGYVVTDDNIGSLPSYIEIVKDVPFLTELPILVVGKKKATDVYRGKKLSVLDKRIDTDELGRARLFWTFSPTERYIDFARDLCNFIYNCIDQYESDFHMYWTSQDVKDGKDRSWKEYLKQKYGVSNVS